MYTNRNETEEFSKLLTSPVLGKTTRGIVVSNKDPQFAGRVKVWIPALHGGFNTSEDVNIEIPTNQPVLPQGASYPGDWKSELVQDLLPWAKCVGHNWGPRQNTYGAVNISGIFSIPKVGTEVFLTFENEDVNLPIVIGTVFHSSEFSYEKYRPLELVPGIEVNDTSLDTNRYTATGNLAAMDIADYTDKAAFSYSIRAENDSMLYISDYPGESAILLSGLIKLTDVDTLVGQKASAIRAAYPGFPTTASAAFAKRILLTDNSIALADPNIKYNPPFDQIAVSPDVRTTLPTNTTPTLNTSPDTKLVKQWPIAPQPGRSIPRFSDGLPNGNFGYPRPYYKNKEKKHCGLDISAAKDNSTKLLAPIDMQPLYYLPGSSSAGNMLVCLAMDGTGHCFMHLASVLPDIIKIIRTSPGTTVKAGTQLGFCGDTGHSSGAHLHWEIFKNASAAKSGNQLEAIREAAQSQGTSQYYNPLEWMGLAVNSNTVIQGSPEQIRSWIDHQTMYANTNDVNYTKPIGLEMSTVPGQETVFLRHPSGAYIGFDCDGNLIGYTPGDANWRINRSWNLDVLGGILESCYARFTRVKTVIRTWAKIFAPMKDKQVADDTYPDFFHRVETHRKIDALVSLRSTLGNAFYVNKDTTPIPMTQAYSVNCKGIITPPNITSKNFTLTDYDSLIKKTYEKYIVGDLKKAFPDWKWFKAQMLLESNGNPNASGGGSIGLFQVTSIAIQDIKPELKNMTTSQFNEFFDPAMNIDIGIQIMVKNYMYVKNIVNAYVAKINGATPFSQMAQEDIRNLTFFTYNVGSGEVRDRAHGVLDTVLSYPVIEAAYKAVHVNDPSVNIHLQYVPTINWIHDQPI